MKRRTRWISTFEHYILTLVNKYEIHFGNQLATMEKLATGAISKRMWFHCLSAIVNLLPKKVGDSYEKFLFASSRRDSIGTNVSDAAWRTHWALKGIKGLSNRDIRVAAMRGFIAKDGTVDILISLLRIFAAMATFLISAILLIYVVFVIALWSAFSPDAPVGLIVFQLFLYSSGSIFMALVYLAIGYAIFVNGILPLSTAHKFKRKEKDFLHNGILYQIA